MEVTVKDGKISVVSAYNKMWVSRAKELGGKWNGEAWVFQEKNEKLVRDALLDIYGENGRPVEKVVVDIKLTKDDYLNQDMIVAGMIVLTRPNRDWAVKCKNDAVIVKGGFNKSSGSMRYPTIGSPTEDTIIRVQIPKTKLSEIEENWTYEEVHTEDVDRAALLTEKETLLKRLAEIESLLGEVA